MYNKENINQGKENCMTAQINDSFRYNDENFSIIAISKPFDFSPVTEFGLKPTMGCTACWKGFWCGYVVDSIGIYLDQLFINTFDREYPDINGVSVEKDPKTGEPVSCMGHHVYKGLNHMIRYSGRILLGKDFMYEYYIHIGYQNPWGYEALTELVFEKGQLVKTVDQTENAKIIRQRLKEKETIFAHDVDLSDLNLWWLN